MTRFLKSLACFYLLAATAFAQERLSGNLSMGTHKVGFTTIESYDMSRPPIREQLSLPAGQQLGRAVQVNVWYPAAQSKKPSTFRNYLDLLPREIDFRAKQLSDEELINAIAVEQANSHGIEINKQAFKQLLTHNLAMHASVDAKPAGGKFPVIIVGPETAFKWCVMAEYLASHGFVVAVTPTTGAREKLPDYERTLFVQQNFVEAAEASIDDLQHMMTELRKLPYADLTRTGLLGYSAGVSLGLGLVTTGFKVQAVVSLEGSIGGTYGPKVLSETGSYSPYLITAPILHFFTPSYGYDHKWLNDEYRYSDRSLIAVYPIRHEDLTTYGMMERFATNITSEEPNPPQVAFETAALYTLQFFKAHVLKEREAAAFIANDKVSDDLQKGVPDEFKGVKRMSALRTFDEYELKAINDRDGFASVQKVFQELVPSDPQPFSTTVFFNFGRFLRKVEDKEQWYNNYVQCYPSSPEAHYLLAQSKERLKKTDEAIAHYEKTLEIFSGSDDVLLEPIFTNVVKRRLEKLRGT